MRKIWAKTAAVSLAAAMTAAMGLPAMASEGTEAVSSEQSAEAGSDTSADQETTKDDVQENITDQNADTQTKSNAQAEEETLITLSDDGILVDGEAVSEDPEAAVYAGADIVYYQEGQDSAYGAGDEDDGHSAEEAAAHTVLTITQPGTYRISGSLSKGQIAIDLGTDSREDETAVVTLILDGADVTCTVASAIVVYNAYECGTDDTETATKDVDTSGAGVHLVLADGSENSVTGSHVAKIYKDGTTAEDAAAGNAKKKWKFDGAIDSLVSMTIDAEEEGTGKLNVTADNEGIETSMHLTINGGEITINSRDDAVNTSEDGVSVLTINGGSLVCNAGGGTEGDGLDSNGWIVINDGVVVAAANNSSSDSGLDSDLGIYINGGTVLGTGNMYDEVASDSEQAFVVLSFSDKQEAGQTYLMKDSDGEAAAAFYAANDFQTLVYSSGDLTDGDYTLYEATFIDGTEFGGIYTEITGYGEETQLQYSSNSVGGPGMGGRMGMGGNPFGGQPGEKGEMPTPPNGEMPSIPDGEMPTPPDGELPSMSDGEMPTPPDGEIPSAPDGEAPAKPENGSNGNGTGANGEAPAKPEDENSGNGTGANGEEPAKPEDGNGTGTNGEVPQGPNGENGQPEGMGGQMNQENSEPSTTFTISGNANLFSGITVVGDSTQNEETSSADMTKSV